MNKLDDKKLENIIGGTSISGTILNAVTNIIKILYEAGEGIGSSIRRFVDGDLCPLK